MNAGDMYDNKYFDPLARAEDEHFWFKARNKIIAAIVNRVMPAIASRRPRVLEVGCGTGNTLRVLEAECKNADVAGMDLFMEGLHIARRRVQCLLVQGDVHQLPFVPGFDLVCLFDVLEHVPDDRAVLLEVRKMLKPGGNVLLTVPAHMSLWSYFDDAAHHVRRYEEKDCRDLFQDCEFEVCYSTEFMALLFPVLWLGRRLAALKNRLRPRKQLSSFELAKKEVTIVPVVNSVVASMLQREVKRIEKLRPIRRGTSILVWARKPQ
jgi:SAM-dependent methyltransferase